MASFCLLPPLLHAALAEAGARAAAPPAFALVADAGSTGTRVYLFQATRGDRVHISHLGKGPALSSFRKSPEQAAESVHEQLRKARELIPPGNHASVRVSIFATAGMRLMPTGEQEVIYQGLRLGLLSAPGGFPFDAGALEARTISGREEGVFALIATNYLAKRVGASLEAIDPALVGVLDLGGSSTQVAAPPKLGPDERFAQNLGQERTFVRSFLNLGMGLMRQRTYQRFVDGAPGPLRARRAVPNPCSFYGYAEAAEPWRGTGDAGACEAAVRAVLHDERANCSAGSLAAAADCLSADPVPTPMGPEVQGQFFLISGYLYVTDFARWWLEQPGVRPAGFRVLQQQGSFATPTVAELRQAATVLCAEEWGKLSPVALDPKSKHRFTGANKIPHRCFELNYIVALLSAGYGFSEAHRWFRIVEDVDGAEIEWTLGAFLHSQAAFGSGPQTQEL